MQILFLISLLIAALICILVPSYRVMIHFNPQAKHTAMLLLVWITVIYTFATLLATFFVDKLSLGYILYAVFILCGLVGFDLIMVALLRGIEEINRAGLILFSGYLFILLFITVLGRGEFTHGEGINMYLFQTIIPQSKYSHPMPMHYLENIALFIPCGIAVYLAGEKGRKSVFKAFYIGCMITVLIESIQGIFHLGICDIDDMTANIAGCMLGYGAMEALCFCAAEKEAKERKSHARFDA